jgi:hypothetical protein
MPEMRRRGGASTAQRSDAKIDRVIVADERGIESEGMRMAREHGVTVAPLYIL